MEPAFLISTFFYIAPCFALLILSFKDQFRLPSLRRVVTGVLLFLAVTFIASRLYFSFYWSSLARSFLGLAGIVSAVCIFTIVVSYHFVHSLFIISVVKSYSEGVILTVSYIHFLFTGTLPGFNSIIGALLIILVTLLAFPLMYLFFKKLMRPALDYSYTLPPWKYMWVIPVSQNLIYTLTISPDFFRDLGDYSEFYFIPPLWLLMCFSSYIIFLRMIISVSENANLQERLHLSETLLNAQAKHAELLQSHIEETRRARHDLHHHILALNGFLQARDWTQLEKYLKDYTAHIPETQSVFCKDPALNALLCHYHENAKEAHIDTSFTVSLPEQLPFPSTDLCVILGNLLENAVEACARMHSPEKFIRLSFSMTSSTILVLVIENSFEGTIHRSGNAFLSTKAARRKGIGISSVIQLTESYNGVHKFEYQDQVFKVSILLNAKTEKGAIAR